jgi:hypothetical protein
MAVTNGSPRYGSEDNFLARDAQIRFDGIRSWVITSYPNGHYTWSGLGWIACRREGWLHCEYSCRFPSLEAAQIHAGKAAFNVIHTDTLPD